MSDMTAEERWSRYFQSSLTRDGFLFEIREAEQAAAAQARAEEREACAPLLTIVQKFLDSFDGVPKYGVKASDRVEASLVDEGTHEQMRGIVTAIRDRSTD